MVRLEAMVTSLVFDHALRIRIKAETASRSDTLTEEPSPTAAPGDNAKGTDTAETESAEEEETSTVHSKTATAASAATEATTSTSVTAVAGTTSQGKAADAHKADSKPEEKSNEQNKNLMGRISNLATSDLRNIMGASDFLTVGESIPWS